MRNKTKLAKRITSFFLAGALAVSAFGTPSLGTASAAGLTADQITEEMKIGWNIGNSLDATPTSSNVATHETAWGNPVVTQELINAVKAKGFNTVRVPTTWYPHVTESNGTYTIDPAWLARVKEVVDYAYNQDMYVILNVHHEDWINRSDLDTAYDEMSPKLTQIWEQIATYFKDYDQHLIFEGMNEPRAKGTTYEWWGPTDACVDVVNKLANDFVETVRSVDSPYKDTRLLMIPGYCASHELDIISKIEFPDDDYVAASVHAYSPYEFTMGTGDHSAFTDAYKASLDTIFTNIQSVLTDKDIPVVIGEFGASDYGYTEARCDWAEYYLTWTKKLGIPCVLWDNDAVGNSDKSECHTYLNRDTNEWYEAGGAVVDSMMAVMDDSTVVWDSEEHKPTYKHDDLSSGTVIWEGSKTTSASSTGEKATGDQFMTGEVAIKFTGTAPALCFMDSSWSNWTEVQPYEVDEANGIAYYKSDTIKSAWGGDVSTIGSWCVKVTSGEVTITKVVGLGEATIDTTPQDTTTTLKTTTTTGTTTKEPDVTTTVTTGSEETPSNGKAYTLEDGTRYTYSKMAEDERMIGWAYTDFGIPAGEKVIAVDVNISAVGSSVGTWQGAFGSSTTVEPDYWTMTEQMEEAIDGKKGTITWTLDEATSAIIDPTTPDSYVKFGVWWIDCDVFKVDSVVIYTDGEGGSDITTTSTTTTTKPTETTATTTKTTVSTTNTTATTTITTIQTFEGQYLQMAGLNAAMDSKYLEPGASGADAVYIGLSAYNMSELITTMRGKYKLSDALAEVVTPYLVGEGTDAFIECADFLYGAGATWYINPDELIFAVSSQSLCEAIFPDGELIFGGVYEVADKATVDAAAAKYGITAQQDADGTWFYAFPIYLDTSYKNWEWVTEDEKNKYPSEISLVETSYIYILADEPAETTTSTTGTTTTTKTTTVTTSTTKEEPKPTGQYLEMAGLNASMDSKYLEPGASGADAVYIGLSAYNMSELITTMRGKYKLSDALAEVVTPYLVGEGVDAFIECADFLYGAGATWYINPDELIFAVSSQSLCEAIFPDGELIFGGVYEVADKATVEAAAAKHGIEATQEADGTWVYKFPIYLDTSYKNWEWVTEDEKNKYPSEISLVETSYIYILADEPAETTTSTTTTTTSTTTTTTKTTATTTKTTTNTTSTTSGDIQWNDLIGDVNLDKKVGVQDIIRLNKYLAKQVTLNAQAMRNAECKTSGGTIDTNDLVSLMRYLVDLVDALPEA